MLIERPPLLYRLLFPGAVWRIGRDKAAYLTFDDGPIPEVTPWVLDQLDAWGAKATFFMVGENARRHPGLVGEVLRRGHAIGNHTMRHTQGAKVTLVQYLDDIAGAESWLGPEPPRLFRPPHGLMGPGQAREVRRRGYSIVMHDVVARDYDATQAPERVVANVMRYVRPGSVIVLHDSLKSWPRLREALPAILSALSAQGWRLPAITI